MSQTASVAVGVPVYNESLYVRDTIAALKAQTGRNFTAYISDNCSSDGTFEIVHKEIDGDPRFCLIQHPRNVGALFNFEYLLKIADADYFMWLGGHDRISSNAVERLAGVLDADPDSSMAMAYPHAMTQDGIDQKPQMKAVYDFSGLPFERYLQSVAQLEDCTIFHAMFRRKMATSFRFESVLGADLPFISMLLWRGHLVYDKQSAYYRRIFPAERAEPSIQMERVTGIKETCHSWENLVEAYMRSFSNVYDDDRHEFARARQMVFDTLIERFGLEQGNIWLPELRLDDDSATTKASNGSIPNKKSLLHKLFRSMTGSR